jgi:hypothetical protein
VGAALYEALADPGKLHPPARVDAEGAGAVLAWNLADPGVDAEAGERAAHQLGEVGKAGLRGAGGIAVPVGAREV